MKDMLIGPDSHKYKIPLEVLTTLLAGTPPTHVNGAKPEKESQSVLDQITSGKVAAPGQSTSAKPPNPLLQMKRQQHQLLHPRP